MYQFKNNMALAPMVARGVPVPFAQAIYSWAGEVQNNHEVTFTEAEVDKLYELFERAMQDTGPKAVTAKRWMTNVPIR